MEKLFCIVIPIYKEILDMIELLSLQRLYNVLKDKNYDIYIVTHKDINLSNIYNLIPNLNIFVEYFDKRYFDGIKGYSQLCVNNEFYSRFSKYEYMYIFQLDVYLVKDNLSDFCKLNYDYIGAPILSTDCGWPTIKTINNKKVFTPAVGNGGFSLRKISKFKDITDPNGEYRTYYNITDEFNSKIYFEDLYFCTYVKDRYDFTVPSFKIAVQFAWDMSADIMYYNWGIKNLPMAIHAWDKNIRLWQTIIPELINNTEIIDFCENKHKDFFKLYYNENNSSLR